MMGTLLTGTDADQITNGELKAQKKFREKRGHAFVVDGKVHDVHSKAVRTRVRVSQDARLAASLGDDRYDAMNLVWSAFMMITAGMGMRTFNPFSTPDGEGDIEKGKALQQLYWQWARRVQELRFDHAMCLDVAVYGYSPAAVDRNRRQCKGKAFDNLLACMDVAVEMGMLKLWKGR